MISNFMIIRQSGCEVKRGMKAKFELFVASKEPCSTIERNRQTMETNKNE